MDTKALAKSKRAHSLHHSKKHQPNPKAKPQAVSTSVGSGKKPAGRLEGEKTSQSHISRELPSNWDRYEESGSGPQDSSAQVSSGQVYDVAPKSKGADYAHLIAEAKAQSQMACSSESFQLLKNPRDEFDVGLGPLLSVKGERMLSWFSEDNFLLDDKGTGSCVASFLSLNLDVLANQLEKANLSELLFIEPDLLSPESVFPEIVEKVLDECGSIGSKATEATTDVFIFDPVSKDQNIHQCDENALSESSNNRFSSTPESKDIDHSVDEHRISNKTSLTKSKKLSSDLSPDLASIEPSRLKAAEAEAELDMLLDSFSETNISDSNSFVLNSRTGQSSHLSVMLGGSSFLPESLPMQHVKEVGDPEHVRMTVTLDDDLDDLLKETSSVIDVNKKSTLHELKAASNDVVSATYPDSKSKVLDDFSSWLDTI